MVLSMVTCNLHKVVMFDNRAFVELRRAQPDAAQTHHADSVKNSLTILFYVCSMTVWVWE